MRDSVRRAVWIIDVDEDDTVAVVRLRADAIGLGEKPIKPFSKIDAVFRQENAPHGHRKHVTSVPCASDR